jgi:3',5'-nucleoside bisphosphate phosphatase
MRTYRADLHIHSCLSPCGAPTMTPRGIVDAALAAGLDLIAVTDHNTAAMTPIVARVAEERGLSFLYGIELQTREDVHLLAYFDDEQTCRSFSDEIYALLPDSAEDPYGLGEQLLVDADGTVLRREPKFLVNGLDLSFVESVARIREVGGLAVPAHVDREFFSVASQLGRLPDGVDFPILEVRDTPVPAFCEDATILRTSDAHTPEQIGARVTYITLETVSVEELRLATSGVGGRGFRGVPLP